MDFTIYRESWRRGGDDNSNLIEQFGDTSLLNSHGMMCCLGQCSLEMGARPADIENVGEPGDVGSLEPLMGVLVIYDDEDGQIRQSRLSRMAIGINDNSGIDDVIREAELKALFEAEGHALTFVDGEYPL